MHKKINSSQSPLITERSNLVKPKLKAKIHGASFDAYVITLEEELGRQ
jgi:hypothetical protein